MLHGGVERGLTDVAKDGLGQKVEWKSEYELAGLPLPPSGKQKERWNRDKNDRHENAH